MSDDLFTTTRSEFDRKRMPTDELLQRVRHSRDVLLFRERVELTGLGFPLVVLVIGPVFVGAFIAASVAFPIWGVTWLLGASTDWIAPTLCIAGYVLGFLYLTRKRNVLQDFLQRKERVHSRELVIDFERQQLVATETYGHATQNNRMHWMPLRDLTTTLCVISVDAGEDDPAHQDVLISFELKGRKQLGFDWTWYPLFTSWHAISVWQPEHLAAAREQANELIAALKARVA